MVGYYSNMWLNALFKRKSVPTDSQELDQLALALAEEVAKETGRSKLDILEEIVETGESLQVISKSSPQSRQNAQV